MRSTTLLLAGLHVVPAIGAWCGGWPAGLAFLAVLHAGLLLVTLRVHSPQFGSALRGLDLHGKTVCLTIDDGPCADTPELLDILDRHSTKAVFFLIGARAMDRPDDVREILRRGHRIGNHTQTHPARTFWAYGPEAQRREIGTCQETLTAITGVRPQIFRAPAGFRNPFTPPVLREQNLQAWSWHARGFDTASRDIPKIVRKLIRRLTPGAILLIHQGQPHHPGLLRQLLEKLSAEGWKCSLPDK